MRRAVSIRHRLPFHTTSGPGSGGFRFLLGLARPQPRLAWLAVRLLAPLNAWEIELGVAGQCNEVLQRLMDLGPRTRCSATVVEAALHAMLRSGDAVRVARRLPCLPSALNNENSNAS
jgi:hypothetical protein